MVSPLTLNVMKLSHTNQSDMEKRQERFRSGELKPLPPHIVKLGDGTSMEGRPAGTGLFSAPKGLQTLPDADVIGAWKD
jgi:hypothetical protein